VVDAFDEGSGVDLHFSLGYQHTWKRAGISRETQSLLVNPVASDRHRPLSRGGLLRGHEPA
jgi:hypothetical protein